jgi:uncharacterized protein
VTPLASFSPAHPGQLVALLAAAVAAGAVNSIAGGGSVITFPVLLFVGVQPILASATNTVALWPGAVAGAFGFRGDLGEAPGWTYWFIVPSVVGGTLGALVLLHTPSRVFDQLAPYLVLAATLLLAVQGRISRRVERDPGRARSRRWWAVAVTAQLAIAVYGGFFGAGISILMLGTLGLIGFTDIHQMNGLKNIYAAFINGAAMVYFVVTGSVVWAAVAVMVGGSVLGALLGARLSHRVGRDATRRAIVVIGFAMAGVLAIRLYV